MAGTPPWLAIAFLLGSCTIQREVPPERFACGNGGPCEDAGTSLPPDIGSEDAQPPPGDGGVRDAIDTPDADAGPQPDTGPPVLAACPKIQPLGPDGLATGDTTSEVNSYEPNCSAPGGHDVVYGFNTAGLLRELTISTDGSAFDTSIHFYRDDCTPLNMITCNDEHETDQVPLQLTSFAKLVDVPPGKYAVVVDAFGPSETGQYLLRVAGRIAPGEPCDPQQAFLTCDVGTCASDAGGTFRCPTLKDCPDGIDADQDGVVDEDTCSAPPTVSCTPISPTIALGDVVELNSTVVDSGTLISRRWTVIERPVGSYFEPYQPNQEAALFYPDLAGSYRVRYTAADDEHQLSACELVFTPEILEALRVELLWNIDKPQHEHHSILDLHLLNPAAPAWFDSGLDCEAPFCLNDAPDWNQQGQAADDPFMYGLRLGPHWVSVDAPSVMGTYGVGVEYEYSNYRPSVSATVNVFCFGILEATLGPVTMTRGDGSTDDNDFWKVAEVNMDAGTCQVGPYMAGPGPLIVSGANAQNSR